MLKNKNYVYGPNDLHLPANLNFGQFMLEKMWKYKDNVALINGASKECTKYSQIAQEATNLAVSLTQLGVKKGEMIAIISESRREVISSLIGSACTGATITHINPLFTKDEINYAMGISDPKYIICSPKAYQAHEKTFKEKAQIEKIIFGTEIPNNVISYNDLTTVNGSGNGITRNVTFEELDVVDVQGQVDTLLVLYSSGTSGFPKGAMLTHWNVLGACLCGAFDYQCKIIMGVGPWFHALGLIGALSMLTLGYTYAFLPKFDVVTFLKTIEKYNVEQLIIVPAVLIAIIKSPEQFDISSVRKVLVGASPVHKDTFQDFLAKYPKVSGIAQAYGMTETTLTMTRSVFGKVRRAVSSNVGQALNNSVLKIVDPKTGQSLGPNQVGEICIKGATIMKGYIGRNQADSFDNEGFLKSGDLGYYDEEKLFYVIDRLKEIIKYKGNQVAPVEIEALLLQHEAVREAGVVGVADKEAGELPMAFVSLLPGKRVTEGEIQEFVAERLSNPKHLRGGVRFLKELPRNATGKILSKTLKSMASSGKSKL